MSHLPDSQGLPGQPPAGALQLRGEPAVRSSRVPEKVAGSENNIR